MDKNRRIIAFALASLLLFIPWAWGAAQKIAIEAERLEHSLTNQVTHCYGTKNAPVLVHSGPWELRGAYVRWDEKAGQVWVKGDVSVEKKGEEELNFRAQELYFWPQTEKIEAKGSVLVTAGDLQATANQATGDTQEIVLVGDPKLVRSDDFLVGSKITIRLTPEERVIVEDARLEAKVPES